MMNGDNKKVKKRKHNKKNHKINNTDSNNKQQILAHIKNDGKPFITIGEKKQEGLNIKIKENKYELDYRKKQIVINLKSNNNTKRKRDYDEEEDRKKPTKRSKRENIVHFLEQRKVSNPGFSQDLWFRWCESENEYYSKYNNKVN